ncbi:chorismate mutase [Breoghania sp. L-A4]|uniref:chorismate mutase n=1 Tax=Breoghania sp. L-A4 TaxID=2304600 RepID=UPI000E35BF13|nr:chorismate mutase [Breoghania sp. L-A4]AXS38848.1 chorismate mutase [Breoghania sp. L-A4]
MTHTPAGAPPTQAIQPDAPALGELRQRIDTIDEQMHRLLIERSGIVDALIKAKGSSARGSAESSGAAFRPGREADMMRRLVERHSGTLPILTVEHIWREIISTFTRLQADYVVHLDGSADAIGMRDLARFYFGFALDLIDGEDADAVVAAVAGSNTDLGVIALTDVSASPWWRALGGPQGDGTNAPRILARLPFLLADGRPADMPALVVSPPVSEPVVPDTRIVATSWPAGIDPSRPLMAEGVEIMTRHIGANGTCDALLACPSTLDDATLAAALDAAGGSHGPLRDVGGYATPIDLDDTMDDDELDDTDF